MYLPREFWCCCWEGMKDSYRPQWIERTSPEMLAFFLSIGPWAPFQHSHLKLCSRWVSSLVSHYHSVANKSVTTPAFLCSCGIVLHHWSLSWLPTYHHSWGSSVLAASEYLKVAFSTSPITHVTLSQSLKSGFFFFF